MRILLSGATGFIGSHLCRALLDQKHQVIALTRQTSSLSRISDLMDRVEVVQIDAPHYLDQVSSANADLFVHAATDYGRGSAPPSRLVQANVLFPLEVLHATRSGGRMLPFINTDSCFSKPGLASRYLAEYTLTKQQLFAWLRILAKEHKVINLRLEHVFGPGDNPVKFVPSMLQRLLDQEEEIALSEGTQRRDFIYVADVVDAYLRVIERLDELPVALHEFEVGRGETTSIRDFMTLMKSVTGSDTALRFGAIGRHEGELETSVADVRTLQALGWAPQVSLDDGLGRCVAWARSSAGAN